ncbi:MAG: MarR family winged helix-turn-helix transcriptional regulator [Burkholderiales bacterium]
MPKYPFLPLIRELAECYQAFESYSALNQRSMGLTSCQFDIIATLGNTPGMSFRELGQKTLITKGTLTGVVNRLEEKKLVVRRPDPNDGRSQIVSLTGQGVTLFERVFPQQLDYLNSAFAALEADEIERMRQTLSRLRSVFRFQEQT